MKDSFENLIESENLVLVDFYADWCAPCKTLAPILKDVSNMVGDKARIVKINVDKNEAIAAKLNIRGIPTLILYKGGQQIWRESGVKPAKTLIDLIYQHS